MKHSAHPLLQFVRLAAVIVLCLSTPPVTNTLIEVSEWLSGAECCEDGCEDSGTPCTQQCVHCVCSGHNFALPSALRSRVVTARASGVMQTSESTGARSGHLDPPFRPPVS